MFFICTETKNSFSTFWIMVDTDTGLTAVLDAQQLKNLVKNGNFEIHGVDYNAYTDECTISCVEPTGFVKKGSKEKETFMYTLSKYLKTKINTANNINDFGLDFLNDDTGSGVLYFLTKDNNHIRFLLSGERIGEILKVSVLVEDLDREYILYSVSSNVDKDEDASKLSEIIWGSLKNNCNNYGILLETASLAYAEVTKNTEVTESSYDVFKNCVKLNELVRKVMFSDLQHFDYVLDYDKYDTIPEYVIGDECIAHQTYCLKMRGTGEVVGSLITYWLPDTGYHIVEQNMSNRRVTMKALSPIKDSRLYKDNLINISGSFEKVRDLILDCVDMDNVGVLLDIPTWVTT